MTTYAEIAITFNQEFEPNTTTNSLSIGYSNFSTQQGSVLTLNIVTTRSNPFEFSAGTDATTQAQLYKDAFDLDYVPSGDWESSISGATVTVKSTNPNIEFNTLFAGSPNNNRIGFVITNVSNTISDTDGLLLARSNYYLSLPLTTEIFQRVKMYFRKGDLTLPFTNPDYEKKVLVPTSTTEWLDILISKFALDFINPTPVYASTNTILDSPIDNLVSTTITSISDFQIEEQERLKNLITTKGYSNYLDGANYLDTNSTILLSSTMHQIENDSMIMIPVVNKGQSITVKNSAGSVLHTFNLTTADTSESKIQYLFFNPDGEDQPYYIVDDTYIFKTIDECKYTPQSVYFLNKFGVYENFTFFKAKNESTNFESESEFKNNFVRGGFFDTSKHLYRTGNKNARTSITLNTGYISEEQNSAIEQILNSDYVYFNDVGTFTPVNVDTKSLQVLSQLNDKLINYSINFKYSFDLVQNV